MPLLQSQVARASPEGTRPVKRLLSNAAFLALLTCAAALSGSAQATSDAAGNDKRAEEQVRQLNAAEVAAFLHKDPKAMAELWSDDFVVTNPLNKFVNKRQVLGMVESGFLVITSYDRQIEYVHVYGDTVIMAGNETVVWVEGCRTLARPSIFASPPFG